MKRLKFRMAWLEIPNLFIITIFGRMSKIFLKFVVYRSLYILSYYITLLVDIHIEYTALP